ncbi:MAG TPA: P-loop NTPase fold protein [Thermoanaerobaculia bacterium]|nr:P-loop NTPase fold protein [Thermoanaerobaculia bacterium]
MDPDALIQAAAHRAITSPNQDRLGREGFVRRLAQALVRDETSATGLVVGLTGPWGSGKSSILSLLHQHIAKKHPSAVLVRFDPWLVSGRDDLIAQFFRELREAMPKEGKTRDNFSKLREDLDNYVEEISSLVDLIPWTSVRALVRVGISIRGRKSKVRSSLLGRREQLFKSLANIRVPIVAFIDEVDRLDDDEIRLMAQLVRSIADFPQISYILAYDADRVAQALGKNFGDSPLLSGRSYIEKIVQLQVPIPHALPEEISALLITSLESIAVEAGWATGWKEDRRFCELLSILVPDHISTLRDVFRLATAIRVREAMVRGEVYWVDILAFCAFELKSPSETALLRNNPGLVVRDTHYSLDRSRWEMEGREHKPAELIYTDATERQRMSRLLEFTFSLEGDREILREIPGDSIAFYRPLMTMLRSGLIPGAFSRAEVIECLQFTTLEEIRCRIDDFVSTGRFDSFWLRVCEVYPTASGIHHERIWVLLSELLDGLTGPDSLGEAAYMGLDSRFGSDFLSLTGVTPSLRQVAPHIVSMLLGRGDIHFPVDVLRDHVLGQGLFKATAHGMTNQLWSEDEAERLSLSLASRLKKELVQGSLARRLVTGQPLFLLLNTGVWDEECVDAFAQALSDETVLDRFITSSFWGASILSHEAIDKIMGLERFRKEVEDRMQRDSFSQLPTLAQEAYRKAVRRVLRGEVV